MRWLVHEHEGLTNQVYVVPSTKLRQTEETSKSQDERHSQD